ncbi:MAG TPA: hypothetical protein VH109_12745 [Steroidobacteraceae bacterium]|nr:hypothetical protein [Steroidobacteraceae bacterium]
MNDKFSASPHMAELIRTHAQRLAMEAEERAQRRLLDLAEQRSDLNPPDVRIRAWEKLHALRLPGDPSHPVLDVIAISTGLTLAQVQEEQRSRGSLRAARTPPPVPVGDG